MTKEEKIQYWMKLVDRHGIKKVLEHFIDFQSSAFDVIDSLKKEIANKK